AAAAANPFAPASSPSVHYGPSATPTAPLRPGSTRTPRQGISTGLILGILAAALVVLLGLAVIVVAVALPAFQQARIAAQRARARSEARARFPSGPASAGSFTPSAPDFGQATAPAAPGSELDQRGGGGMVDDNLFGFTAAFPAGFTAPMPQQSNRSVGLGGTASTQTFRATSPSGAAYILCYAFSPEVFDQVQGQLFSLGESALRKSAGGALSGRSTRYQGYAAREVEFGAARGRAGRARMVLARPRLFVIAFEARDRSLLNKPGVTAYLDSLQIRDNVYPPSVQSPLMAPGRSAAPPMPTPQRMAPQFPEGRFGPGGPPEGSFGGPNIPPPPSGFPRSRFRMGPGGSPPDFTPPSIPSPPDIPTPPTPNFPPSGGPPSFGPPGTGGS
ncbi:MAG: hypothetical protein ACO1SX_25995, partial [Actinomycetota bacterium]